MPRNRHDHLLDRLDAHRRTAPETPLPDELIESIRERFDRAERYRSSRSKGTERFARLLRSTSFAAARTGPQVLDVIAMTLIASVLTVIGVDWVFALLFWTVAIILLLRTNHRNRKKNIVTSAVHQGVCLSCGYDLRGLASVSDARLGDVHLGPAVCPECGYRWPRVPPHFHFVPTTTPAPGAVA